MVDLHPPRDLGVAELERDVEDPRRPQPCRFACDHVSTVDRVDADPGEVHGDALAGRRPVHGGVVDLRAPHPGALSGRQQRDAVAGPERSRPQGPGDHGARAADRERPIDVEQRRPVVRPLAGQLRGDVGDRGADLLDAGARADRAVDDRHPVVDQCAHLFTRPGRVGEVGLRHGHDPRADPERAQHRRVLDGLRHHAVVGGDDEQEQVHAGRAGDHRAHEALVTRNVDERQQPAADVELGEAEVDRHTAGALLREPIGVAPGEGTDQRGLPVVDVPGRPDRERQGAAHTPPLHVSGS